MNNEPVAWMDYLEHSDFYDLNVSGRGIPLYTHPAKTLTDEEIEEFEWVIKKHFHFNPNEKVVGLDRIIRAILKKASEK
jgi:hypothetical protein